MPPLQNTGLVVCLWLDTVCLGRETMLVNKDSPSVLDAILFQVTPHTVNFAGRVALRSYGFKPQCGMRPSPPPCSCIDAWPTLGPRSGLRTLQSPVRKEGTGQAPHHTLCPPLHLASSVASTLRHHRFICIFPNFYAINLTNQVKQQENPALQSGA